MPKVREGIGAKWVRRAGSATEEYKLGVQQPTAPWKASTLAAAATHTQALQQAIANKSFEKGVARSSDQSWQEGALKKGADRFAPGVAAAEESYNQGFEPYKQVINSITLPPRGPKGDPKNYERSSAMGKALNAKKKSL